MIGLSVKTKVPDLDINTEIGSNKWLGIAVETQKSIRKRTETAGKDVNGRPFKPYSADYSKKKATGKVSKPGGGFYGSRSAKPNLSLSTRMLASMRAVGRKTRGLIVLSGHEGFKAYVNELKGRAFFDISKKEADVILRRVADFVSRKNKLKKR